MDKEIFKYRVAAATSDGIVVNKHYGRADNFRIYDIGIDNSIVFVEERKTVPVCQGGNHDEIEIKKSVRNLSDCRYVLVSRIGQGAANALEQEGIIPMELPGIIEESIHRLITYEKIQSLFI